MSISDTRLRAIPTNIITGFLGAGKTTAILHLLKHKPHHERWAVLVNEFGDIGVDGSLFQGQHTETGGVYIREVPGGCMCCAAGLPMQIALNQLLAQARPDRLLIEPTGLGHPLEMLQTLSSEHYQDVLSVQKVVTLVDARKLSDPRYTGHDTFNQQIAIADVLVGNKQDLYAPADRERLKMYGKDHGLPSVQVVFTEQGTLAPSWLTGATAATSRLPRYQHREASFTPTLAPIAGYGQFEATIRSDGFRSIGWRLDASHTFSRRKLMAFLGTLAVERMKAVFLTDAGVFGYNLTEDGLTEMVLDDCLENRLEIIATDIDPEWEPRLTACINTPSPD